MSTRPDRYFKFEHGGPKEVSREEAKPDFWSQACARGITRVSYEDSPIGFTIHCDGHYAPGELENLQGMLNAELHSQPS